MATARVVHLPLDSPRRSDDRSPHLRVVRPVRSALRLSPRMGVVLTVVAFVALFAVAACHALLIEGQAEVDQLDRDVAAQQARYEELRLEVAELKSPSRVRSEAIEELGMVPAGETVFLTAEEPVPADDEAEPVDSPDTSAARVKPYLEGAP
jgi:cell division protein FtsL